MKKLNTLLTAEIDQDLIRPLEDELEIHYAGWVCDSEILSEDKMAELAAGREVLITSYDPVTRRVIDCAPDLQLIVCTRANPVNVDVAYANSKGIRVIYTPGRNSDCTAEFTVALMLSITRKIPMAYRALKNGIYTSEEKHSVETKQGLRRDVTWALGKNTPYIEFKGFQMHGHTLGIIGYGSIGRRVAAICRGFGMEIVAYDPWLSQANVEDYVTLKSFDETIAAADILTVHCKDTPETERIINADVFRRMKKSAFFVNTSRGALVDEAALIEALRGGEIAGAAVDVFDSEPIAKDHPFITELDNIVITPHLAGATYDAISNHTRQIVSDVQRYLRGEPLEFEFHLK